MDATPDTFNGNETNNCLQKILADAESFAKIGNNVSNNNI